MARLPFYSVQHAALLWGIPMHGTLCHCEQLVAQRQGWREGLSHTCLSLTCFRSCACGLRKQTPRWVAMLVMSASSGQGHGSIYRSSWKTISFLRDGQVEIRWPRPSLTARRASLWRPEVYKPQKFHVKDCKAEVARTARNSRRSGASRPSAGDRRVKPSTCRVLEDPRKATL